MENFHDKPFLGQGKADIDMKSPLCHTEYMTGSEAPGVLV